MKRHSAIRDLPDRVGQRLAAPAMLLGSLFAIALLLYAIDTTQVAQLLP